MTTSSATATTATTGDPPNPCGDGDLDGAEFCDHGDANGEQVGDCAPDCSAFIHEASIMVSEGDLAGDLGAGGNPVAVADALCETEFGSGARAMFADGVNRRATMTANVGDNPIDWVLNPWTRYLNDVGDLVWLTNATPLLGVEDGSMNDLLNPLWVHASNYASTTGMQVDWRTLSEDDCSGWTTTSGFMAQGNPWFVEPDFLQLPGTTSCGNSRSIYCVVP